MSEGYKKLLFAIQNNQLYEYLTAKGDYRIFDEKNRNISINNDYEQVSRSLNDYGKTHPEFSMMINKEMQKILDNNKIGEIYSVCQLIRTQIIKNSITKNDFNYVDENLLLKLKESILKNKEKFEKLKIYESELKERGMMQVFEIWDNEVSNISGKHIL